MPTPKKRPTGPRYDPLTKRGTFLVRLGERTKKTVAVDPFHAASKVCQRWGVDYYSVLDHISVETVHPTWRRSGMVTHASPWRPGMPWSK